MNMGHRKCPENLMWEIVFLHDSCLFNIYSDDVYVDVPQNKKKQSKSFIHMWILGIGHGIFKNTVIKIVDAFFSLIHNRSFLIIQYMCVYE